MATGFDVELCRRLCRERGLTLGRRIEYRAATDSTNDDALALAAGGAEHGLVVLADRQHGGRGRQGTQWFSEPGEALTFSLVLRESWRPSELPLLPLLFGLGVREVAQRLLARPVLVKWPNDVLVEGRKLCGILSESCTRAGASAAVVVGIGLNLGIRRFPADLAGRATSLALEGTQVPAAERLLADLLAAFERRLERLAQVGFQDQCRELRRFDALVGRSLRVAGMEGIAAGIADNGGLVLRAGGCEQVMLAGSVELLD